MRKFLILLLVSIFLWGKFYCAPSCNPFIPNKSVNVLGLWLNGYSIDLPIHKYERHYPKDSVIIGFRFDHFLYGNPFSKSFYMYNNIDSLGVLKMLDSYNVKIISEWDKKENGSLEFEVVNEEGELFDCYLNKNNNITVYYSH